MLAICDGDRTAAQVEKAASSLMPELWVRTMRASEQGVTVI